MRHRSWLLAGLGLLLYVAWLDTRDLWYPGEPDLAEVCQAMFRTGEWAVPRRNGEVFLNYPPLHYWAAAFTSWLLGGMSDFALRLPTALSAVGLVLATGAAAARWVGPRAGLWAGLVLLTSSQFGYQAISYRPDMLFAFFAGAGVLTYAAGQLAGERPRPLWSVAGFLLLGVAVLVKGPLGLLLPGLVLVLWHGSRREWRSVWMLVPLGLLALAVVAPWLAAVARSIGTDGLTNELSAQNLGRFASGERGHGRPFFYYLLNFWFDFAPWSLLAPAAGIWLVRSGLWRDRAIQLGLWWLGTFAVFLSLAATKRQAYLLPAYPAVALLLGAYLGAVGRRPATASAGPVETPPPDERAPAWFLRALEVALPVVGVAALVAAVALGPLTGRMELDDANREAFLGMRIPLAVVVVAAGPAWWWLRRARRAGDVQAGLLRAAATVLLVIGVVVAAVFPLLDPANRFEPQVRWIGERLGSEARIGFLGSSRKVGAFGYYTGAIVERVSDEAGIEAFFRDHPDSFVVVNADRAGPLWASTHTDWGARVVYEFDAARRHYLVLRGP